MLVVVSVLAVTGGAWASVYTVSNTNDAGPGSLRLAIAEASAHIGADQIVFQGIDGQTIQPLTPLPTISDKKTTITGDTDSDGAPEIRIDGSQVTAGSGLQVLSPYCTVAGLSVTGFPDAGIDFRNAAHGLLRACYVGVDLAGAAAAPNLVCDVRVAASPYTTIGGSAADRNLIGSGVVGIDVLNKPSSRNRPVDIVGDYFGVTASGLAALGSGGQGIVAHDSYLVSVAACVFGGLAEGVVLQHCTPCGVYGSYFGLAADGSTVLPIGSAGIRICGGSSGTGVAGAYAGANVFAGGAPVGVLISGQGTHNNTVSGNYFGLNAAGTEQRPLGCGVRVENGAGAQTIGGTLRPNYGNWFAATPSGGSTVGLVFDTAGTDSTVANNKFGVLPGPAHTTVPIDGAVTINSASLKLAKNTIAQAATGILLQGGVNNLTQNKLAGCGDAVRLESEARARIGPGNRFALDNTCDIRNLTANNINAEKNDMGTTVGANIDAKIWDQLDDPSLGLVDYSPLWGGIIPSVRGTTGVAVTSVSAVRTARGAEVVFSLSAPAQITVSVMNIAGRAVATPARDVAAAGGMNRVVWSGLTATGTQAPNGRYLVRVTARGAGGGQTQALCTLTLAR